MNLFFRILRKRFDGYHEIASFYQTIDLFDRLFFSNAKEDALSCSDPQIPLDETNLVKKALKLFRSIHSTPPIQIHIEKKIPIQAGLGGGSSNAATTLWALNERMGRPISIEQLMDLGKNLGSDVPFFFSSGSAYCTGRGEIIEEITHRSLMGYLAKPDFGLSTSLVYQHVKLFELPARDPQEALARISHTISPRECEKCGLERLQFFNDLEFASFRLEPKLQSLKELLKIQFKSVTMTGSGTAFFCLDGEPSPIKGVTFFPFRTIVREAKVWY